MAKIERLIKIASEINIGRDAIVEHLINKGFDIENKPTAFLTPEMVESVYEKFKKELRLIEKQREKVERMKQIRKTAIDAKSKTVSKEPAVVPIPEELEEIPVETEAVQPKKKINVEASFDNLIEELDPSDGSSQSIKRRSKSKVVDVEEIIEVVQPEEKVEEIKKQEPEVKEIKTEVPQQSEIKKGPEKYKKRQPFKPGQQERTDRQPFKSGQQERTDRPPYKSGQQERTDRQPFKPGQQERTDRQPFTEQSSGDRPRKKKKSRTVAEVEIDSAGRNRIKGLTIVGRIDLDADKKKRAAAKAASPAATDAANLPKYKKKSKGAKDKPFEVGVGVDKPEKRKRKRKSIRSTISEAEVDKAIRATLSGMEDSAASGQKTKLKQKKRALREEKELKIQEEKHREERILKLTEFVTTSDLSNMMGVNANEIILKCMGLGLMVSINQRLDKDTITLIADDYGLDVEFLDDKAIQVMDIDDEDPPETLQPRSPIVTIMGHVDHGKTSLLDFIRKSNVVAGESGGITQHIGAYRVSTNDGKFITFLDTPGHEAFTAMRARGALVTDLVILVVAADDSVMPQTIEAISHAQAARVPIVVAINKIDKEDAQPDRIKQQLTDYNVLVEEWGGKNQSAEISAKKGINIDVLLEKVLLEAEMLELKANPNRLAKGTIVESNMDKGLGPIATVIVQKGTLKVGDYFVAGTHWGRVRAMFDERMNKVEEVKPSMPVRVVGFDGLPEAGDIFQSVEAEYQAKNIANESNILKRQQDMTRIKNVSLDELSKQIQAGGIKDLNLIIKADVGGSAEAIADSLHKLSTSEVRVNILHKGVGSINESDVMLAAASGAVVIGFNVTATGTANKIADVNSVEIRHYNIIYDCIEEVRLALEGLLTPDLKENATAEVEIRKVFKISRMGSVAGCYVLSGKISRNDKIRVLRDGLPIFTGTMSSLKREKDDVREVLSGYECGIMLNGFNALEVGDIIEAYKIVEVKRTLD